MSDSELRQEFAARLKYYMNIKFGMIIKENFVEINGLKQINFSFKIMENLCTLIHLASGFKIL